MANNNKIDVLSEQLSEKEVNEMDADSTTDEWASPNTTIDLQNCLCDALEKNKQWLEYDQQREAYVRAILARMLWLEKQLNEANQARSQQHNEDHSDEKEQMRQMQKYYESLLQRAKDQLDVLRKELDMAQHNLIMTQSWCKERESEVDELKQQLQTENMNRESTQEDHHYSEDEEHWLTAVTEDLQYRLDEEERKSASSELQSTPFEKFLLDRHRADQERIADLERQIKISSQDLEDEKQDCLYLQKQMVRILKTLKPKDHVTKQSKRDRQDCTSCEEAYPPSLRSRDSLTSSTHSSSLNESFLECPGCWSQYPASHHRELMTHLEVCLD
uniref:centrosomal protein of 55 kDa-like n=1 Tax=Epinephelus lanceolatus TaxID=310571 RepID=UPI0014458FB5|nr:centrosomal protein of 55 kDa-like [Epinephelus lanceolatus]